MPVSDAERARRRQHVDASSLDAALEGLTVTSATHEDEDAYVAGLIDLAEFGRRVRARYYVVSDD